MRGIFWNGGAGIQQATDWCRARQEKNRMTEIINSTRPIMEKTSPHAVDRSTMEIWPESAWGSPIPLVPMLAKAFRMPMTVPIRPNMGGAMIRTTETQMARLQNFIFPSNPEGEGRFTGETGGDNGVVVCMADWMDGKVKSSWVKSWRITDYRSLVTDY
jgi:hypothetical protein